MPDHSPAGEPPDTGATESRPTGAGTTWDTAAASATEARREDGTGRDGKNLPVHQLLAGIINDVLFLSTGLFFVHLYKISSLKFHVLEIVFSHPLYVCK